MPYTLPKGYLSASSIGKLLTCPKQFEFRYIKNLRVPKNKALSLGSIVHKTFEAYYKDVLETSNRLSGKQLAEASMDAILPAWFSENENIVTAPERSEVEQLVPDIVSGYADNVGRYITPLQIEQEVRVTMKNGVDMLAYLDLVRLRTGRPNGIVDYKITGRPWKVSSLQTSVQFMLYSYLTGLNDVQIHNVVTPKAGKAVRMASNYKEMDDKSRGTYEFDAGSNMNIIGNEFSNTQEEYLEDLVESCARMITAGIFPPCAPSSWACSPKWCDYWRICKRGQV